MSQSFHLVHVVSDEDRLWGERLDRHLRPLQRQGLLTTWSPHQMHAGTDRQEEWKAQLAAASIIVLLISPDSIASDECMYIIQEAQVSHKQILPVLIRPATWHLMSISHLSPLPQNGKPLSLWPNRDAGLLEIANAIQNLIDPHHAITQPLPPAASLSTTSHRQRLLARLRSRYTEVLKQSLQGSAPIMLALHTDLDVLEHPTDRVFRHLRQSEKKIPAGTSLLQIYDRAGGELLILGEPGAGKSILVLHLAQDLLTRAEANEQSLPPVILNLSSWAEKRQPIAEWLVEELWVSYQIPRKLGQLLVQTEQFLPFLDGLDEVPSSMRSACIDAINSYRQNHLVSPVVCSRTTDYFSQQHRLVLECAIAIQPLTQEQIDSYIGASGSSFAAVSTVLQHNLVFNELVTSPLMLNIVMQAYRDTSVEALPKSGSQEEQQKQIFDYYIQRMLPSKGIGQRTASQRILKRLIWLAHQMQQRNQTTFYLEQLQPDWLSRENQKQVYKQVAVHLFGLLAGIGVSTAIFMLFFFPSLPVPVLLLYILLGGMLGTILSRESTSAQFAKQEGEVPRPFRQVFLQWVGVVILVGIVFGQDAYRIASSTFESLLAVISGLSQALSFGLCCIPLRAVLKKANRWNPSFLPHFMKRKEIYQGIFIGMLAGLSSGLSPLFNLAFVCLFNWLKQGPGPALEGFRNQLPLALSGLIYGLPVMINYGFIGSLLSILLSGKSWQVQPTDRLIWSWKSLRKKLFLKQHINTTLWSSLLVALDYGLSYGLISRQNEVLNYKLSIGLGLRLGLTTLLSFGLSYWLLIGLFQGVSSETIDTQQRAIPNQGIHRSLSNGFLLGLASMIIVMVISSFSYVLNDGLNSWGRSLITQFSQKGVELNDLFNWTTFDLPGTLRSGLVVGLVIGVNVGLLVGLLHGGLAFLRHFFLRFLLWQGRSIPWRLSQCLDEAARYILLYKVGGGYTFIHRQFRDYIAVIEKDQFLVDGPTPLRSLSQISPIASGQRTPPE